ncbi:MAG: hypothetical protein ACI9UT_000891, partial [Flavobacteriales bacterium]
FKMQKYPLLPMQFKLGEKPEILKKAKGFKTQLGKAEGE